MNASVKTIRQEWEDVYAVMPVTENLWTENFPEFHKDTTYYQTYGGGPEGGYFVKVGEDPKDLNKAWCAGVWKVRRHWYKPWSWEKLPNTVLEYEPADEMKGKGARCRLVQRLDLTQTRDILDQYDLWGNAIEIVKCLRDGLGPKADAGYKDLCLKIILNHFQVLDEYLELLPQDSCPRYKEVLHNLGKEESDEEDSDSE